ncbi:MAG: hypothetical protein HYZ15_05125 [Sphingobacteriales bacterium]|nr:hypothetical protein [Sphingobacteriales bacterium]
MRIFYPVRLCLLAFSSIALFSCNEKESFTSAPLSDYLPLTARKFIIYRLDSMVFTNFGRSTEVHKYQVKDLIDTMITDNLGRSSYRVYRFLRDTAGTQPWQPAGSYFITPLADQVEVVEDNLRFIKMHLPLRNGFSWKGNKYLPADPYGPLFNFSNDDSMEDWDYYYDGDAGSFSYGGFNYADVFSVEQIDESFNVPITTPTAYAAKSRSVEKYSKNIGLIYREYELWEYQPNPGGAGGPYKTGFGITMWMVDHN